MFRATSSLKTIDIGITTLIFPFLKVAELYRDPSIGTKINIEVSKLMLLYNMPVSKKSSLVGVCPDVISSDLN